MNNTRKLLQYTRESLRIDTETMIENINNFLSEESKNILLIPPECLEDAIYWYECDYNSTIELGEDAFFCINVDYEYLAHKKNGLTSLMRNRDNNNIFLQFMSNGYGSYYTYGFDFYEIKSDVDKFVDELIEIIKELEKKYTF